MMRHQWSTRRWLVTLIGGLSTASILLLAGSPPAQSNRGTHPALPPPAKPVAPAPPRTSLLTTEVWQKASMTPLQSGELDQLVRKELQETKVEPAPRTTDEQFIRRVYLDV